MTQALNLENFANNLNTSGQTSNSGLQNPSLTITAGSGISGGGSVSLGSSVTISNGGVTAVSGGTGIGVSASTGSVTITNNGVTSVNGSTGAVTVPSFGYSQSWTDVTGSRSIGSSYTNSTSKPIMVSVSLYADSSHDVFWYVSVGGVIVGRASSDGAYGIGWSQISVVVPVGATYTAAVSAGANQSYLWAELS